MREDDSNWFTKWEDELPRPDELMPISQTLITRDLALAFDIRGSGAAANTTEVPHMHHHHQVSGIAQAVPQPNSSEFDSSSAELGGGSGSAGGGGGGVSNGLGMAASDEPARTLKRPRLVWTPQLHKRFVDAVAHLGIKNAVPKTIMQLMSVDGLTRENVASHLQKYRLYLKRMQGLTNGNGPGPNGIGPGGSAGGSGDSATDRLFASSPVPPHFLHQSLAGGASTSGGGRPNTDSFMSYMPVAAAIHHHHQQMVSSHPHNIQAQYPHQHHHRQMGHYGSPPIGSPHYDQHHHLFVSRQAQNELLGTNRNGIMQISAGFVEAMESGSTADDPRKILTLFPTSD